MNVTRKNITIALLFILLVSQILIIGLLVDENRNLGYQLARMKDNECTKLGGMIFQGKCVDNKIFVELGK